MIRPRTTDALGCRATLTRFGASTLLWIGLTGCAAGLLPVLLVPQVAATLGVGGLSAASCGGNSTCEPEAAQCASPTDKKIEVTQAADIEVPANEGKVTTFSPAYWQPQFVSEVAPRGASAVEATAGIFAITDKSIAFVPPPGTAGVRVPLASVLNVEVQQSSTTGAPRQLTVESCFGRLDRFTFGQSKQPRQLDSKATADAAAEVSARIAAMRSAARN